MSAQTPAQHPSVVTILRNHAEALRRLHVQRPTSHEISGTLTGLQLTGTFHEWQDGTSQRRDEHLGTQTQHQLRVGDRMWLQSMNGQVREIQGIAARRQITEDFIDSEAFAAHGEDVKYLGADTLRDGRPVYQLEIEPRGGEPYIVSVDEKSWLIDEKSFVENDTVQEVYYDDYRVVDGLLVPFKEVSSTGSNPAYDITTVVDKVSVNQPIAASVFAPLTGSGLLESGPVTVPVAIVRGLPFVDVKIQGHAYHFLVDSGSQGDVIDPRVASELGLHPEGNMQISAAVISRSLGVVALPTFSLGGADFSSQLATVFDLSKIASDTRVDGVLGEPFFESAELRFDPDRNSLTIAPPGSLPALGEKIDVDTDRERVEVAARINREADTRLIVDTGSNSELLIYQSFLGAHPNVVNYAGSSQVENRGANGSNTAVATIVDELQIGGFHMFNRRTHVILASGGAFADRIDGGNVGFATLHNFIATFDVSNKALYLERARSFDDGRYRSRTETFGP